MKLQGSSSVLDLVKWWYLPRWLPKSQSLGPHHLLQKTSLHWFSCLGCSLLLPPPKKSNGKSQTFCFDIAEGFFQNYCYNCLWLISSKNLHFIYCTDNCSHFVSFKIETNVSICYNIVWMLQHRYIQLRKKNPLTFLSRKKKPDPNLHSISTKEGPNCIWRMKSCVLTSLLILSGSTFSTLK